MVGSIVDTYRLKGFGELNAQQIALLTDLCRQGIDEFVSKRGAAI